MANTARRTIAVRLPENMLNAFEVGLNAEAIEYMQRTKMNGAAAAAA